MGMAMKTVGSQGDIGWWLPIRRNMTLHALPTYPACIGCMSQYDIACMSQYDTASSAYLSCVPTA